MQSCKHKNVHSCIVLGDKPQYSDLKKKTDYWRRQFILMTAISVATLRTQRILVIHSELHSEGVVTFTIALRNPVTSKAITAWVSSEGKKSSDSKSPSWWVLPEWKVLWNRYLSSTWQLEKLCSPTELVYSVCLPEVKCASLPFQTWCPSQTGE